MPLCFVCVCVCRVVFGPFAQSVDIPKWPFTVASYVGAGLLSRLIDTAKLSLSDNNKLVALSNSYRVFHVRATCIWHPLCT